VRVLPRGMSIQSDHVDRGCGESMLEADFRQAAVAGPAHPGDVEGLVDRALDAGSQGVLACQSSDFRSVRARARASWGSLGRRVSMRRPSLEVVHWFWKGAGATGQNAEGDDDRVLTVLLDGGSGSCWCGRRGSGPGGPSSRW
jgi:hypothetical protein